MPFNPTILIKALTISCLVGLLLGVGLRLTASQVFEAVRKSRLLLILLANFVVVPAGVVMLTRLFKLPTELAIGMVLLAAAPFAPVVPVFAKMARADLALAAGLTSFIPFLSAFLTPVACELALRAVPNAGPIRFSVTTVLLVLLATITLPLLVGVSLNHLAPQLGRRLLRPVEVVSEGTGLVSLTFVVATEFGSILETGGRALLAMVISSEASLVLGYWLGGRERAARRVVALGTSNRNIALALLVALESFAGTAVVPAVVANGLLLILLGLVHVVFWRCVQGSEPQRG